MTTIEDFARTICLAVWNHDYTPRDPKHPDERWAQALAAAGAVIEKHIGPLIVRAVDYGEARGKAGGKDLTGGSTPDAVQYAARILSALTATGRE